MIHPISIYELDESSYLMNALHVKLYSCLAVVVLVIAGVSITGLTSVSAETTEGAVIDFGYYDITWTAFDLKEGQNAIDVLNEVCDVNDFERPVIKDGCVFSINDVENLQRGMEWNLYVLGNDNRTWNLIEDHQSYKIGSERIICWARSSDLSEIMPASDYTGYVYYGYADSGITPAGERIRVASLTQTVTETVIASNGGEYIVGTDRISINSDTFKQLNVSATDLGSGNEPNFEKIMSVHPDLVILDGSLKAHTDIADKLRKTGIDALVLYGTSSVPDVYRNIWICSSALGFSEKGNDYLASMNSTTRTVCNIFNQESNVFVAASTDESPYTYGQGTYVQSILDTLGLHNVFNQKGEFKVSAESIYNVQPDVIIILMGDSKIDTSRSYNSVLEGLNELWKDTPAYNKGQIYIFSGKSAELFNIPGPRVTSATELTAKVIDQESFTAAFPSDKVHNYFSDDYRSYLVYQSKGAVI